MKRLILPITCGLLGMTIRPLSITRIACVVVLVGVIVWYAVEEPF
jgi:hypothetical protein